ncbi:MAG: PD-(D/E)XK nuclease family protein [Chloroflexi bacterium]|nr:PD-(D/E)XK nuclease family protein [Chloroflexota bacterium]
MTTQLIIAPPATGKTFSCIQRIQEVQKDHPLAQVWVLVPDRLQAGAFRRRLALAGGSLRVEVGRFGDLFGHLLESAGSFIPAGSPPLLHRLVQDTVDRAVEQGAIPYFAPLQIFPGFILALRDAFAELKRARVSPEGFSSYTVSGTPAQQDLATLFARYQSRLQELRWADPEDLTLRAITELERNSGAASPIRLLVVDGFDKFNNAQHRALELLSGQVGELVVTLPGWRDSRRPAHRRFIPGIDRLIRELSPRVTKLENPPYLPPVLQRIENSLFEFNPAHDLDPVEPFLLEARSPAEEAREVLRWIKKRVVRENVPLSACALFTPNPITYHPLLRAAADEFGIPLRFTLDEPLEDSPAVSALIHLLSLPAEGTLSRALFNVLRSPYFDFSIDNETVNTLEQVSRVAQIVEGQDQWQAAWERLETPPEAASYFLEDEQKAPDIPRGEAVAPFRLLLEGVFQTISPPPDPLSHAEWILWLEDLLERLHFYENAESERDQAACEIFRETLRALVLSETVAGQRSVDYRGFLSDLKATLPVESYREPAASGAPALVVGRMLETRGTRFQAVALLGLSEGSYPVNEREDPFLSEKLRADLGLEPRLGLEQAGLFYQAVTRTDKHLLLTRPYMSEDGEEWEPSAFWKAITALFVEKKGVLRVSPENDRPLEEAASSQELLFTALRHKTLPGKYNLFAGRWHDLQHAKEVLQARRGRKAGGPYEGLVEAVTPALAERFSSSTLWSSSRLEGYSNCPFRFWVGSALDLDPRTQPQLGLEVSHLGSILHEILELTFRNAPRRDDLDSVLGTLQSSCDQVFSYADKKFGFRPSALWKNEQVQMRASLEKTVRALVADGTWTPIAFEEEFGLEDRAPLVIALEGESMNVHGVIDRVDRNAAGKLRVIDYKTGGSFSNADLEKGHRLQLPIYALAARDTLKMGEVVEGMYWKINEAKSGALKLSTFAIEEEEAKGIDLAYRVVREHLKRIVSGIRSAQFQPETPVSGCPDYCPAVQWCWRFEAGWKP